MPLERIDNNLTGEEYDIALLRALFGDSEEVAIVPQEPTLNVLHADALHPETGEIWKTRESFHTPFLKGGIYESENPRLVLIIHPGLDDPNEEMQGAGTDYQRVEALPLSLQYQYATPDDLEIPSEFSPIGCGFMVQAGMRLRVLRGQLESCVGLLDSEDIETALLLRFRAEGVLKVESLERLRYALIGEPLSGQDDLRIRFKEQEARNLEYLTRAVADFEEWLAWQESPSLVPSGILREFSSLLSRVEGSCQAFDDRIRRLTEERDIPFRRAMEDLLDEEHRLAAADNDERAAENQAFHCLETNQGVYPLYEGEEGRIAIISTKGAWFLYVRPAFAGLPIAVKSLTVDDRLWMRPDAPWRRFVPAENGLDDWIELLPLRSTAQEQRVTLDLSIGGVTFPFMVRLAPILETPHE